MSSNRGDFKLYARQVMKNSEPYLQITGWDNCIPRKQLPTSYTISDGPYFYQVDTSETESFLFVSLGFIKDSNLSQKHKLLKAGDLVPPEAFQLIVETIRKAGERLHAIRETGKEIAVHWNKNVVVDLGVPIAPPKQDTGKRFSPPKEITKVKRKLERRTRKPGRPKGSKNKPKKD